MNKVPRNPLEHTGVRPVLQRVVVPLTPHAAFDLFTEDLPAWWPVSRHSLSGGRLRMDARTGGKITEDLPDGTKAAWARITAWQPGTRLGLLWHPGEDEEDGTLVDVRFRALGTGTEVTVEHALPGTGGLTASRATPALSTAHAREHESVRLATFAPAGVANCAHAPARKAA